MNRRKVLCFCTPFNNDRIGGILRYAREHQWHIILSSTEDRRFLGWDADGVLATIRDTSAGATIHQFFTERGTPIVDLTIERADLDLPRVICDHEAIGRMAGEHLYDRGFRSFAWFSAGWSNVHTLRYRGFAQGVNKEDPMTVAKWNASQADWSQFITWIKPLLCEAPKPLGILAYDEVDAARLLSACNELALNVPEQVAVVSCGNEPLVCDFQPVTITGIETNLGRQGYVAAHLLDTLMSGEVPANETQLIHPESVSLRQSSDVYTSTDPTLRVALKYISDNLSESISTSVVAKALHMPHNQLAQLFLKTQKRSVGNEIIRQRLVHAQQLLLKTNLSVREISKKCGYCDICYLVNSFRGLYGMPPATYRRRHANQRR